MTGARRAACAAVAVVACLSPATRAAEAAPRARGGSSTEGRGQVHDSRRSASALRPEAHEVRTALPSRHPDARSEPKTALPRGREDHGHEGHLGRDGRDGHVGRGASSTHPAKRALPPLRPLRPIRATPANASWRTYRRAPWQRGFVRLFGHGKEWSGYLVDKYGEVIPASRRSLSSVLASWRTGKQMLIDEKLLALVADVSDEFGGRPIRIVSGYREHSYAPDSRHKTGEAFDFSIPGVPNEAVRDLLRSLPDVGVGYYPNSTHVHLDVRDKPTYWVDYSRPGDQPLYAWDRRVAGFTPAERALATALDSIASHARASQVAAVDHGSAPEPHGKEHADPARSAQVSAPSVTPASSAPHHAGVSAVDADRAEDEREEDGGEPGSVESAHAAPPSGLLPRAPPAASFSNAPDSGRR